MIWLVPSSIAAICGGGDMRYLGTDEEGTYATLLTQVALACSVTFQYASTGTQENIEVNRRTIPQAPTITRAMYTGMRISCSVKMRWYCSRIDILVTVRLML